MDSKDGNKKESIDEILSDLNGLLNKMPSILDGIKMPELKPAELPREPVRSQEQEPPKKNIPEAQDADKTVVLQAFSGLPEGADSPEERPAQPAPDADVTPIPAQSLSPLPEGGQTPDAGKLVPQSLGDFMFGGDVSEQGAAPAKLSGAPLEPPVERQVEDQSAEEKPKLSISELNAPQEIGSELPPDAMDFPVIEPEAPAEVRSEPLKPTAGLSSPRAYESTRDFGVPDIDALMQLSEGEIKGVAGQEPPQTAQPLAAVEAEKAEPSIDELAEFERQMQAALPQGEAPAARQEDERQQPPPGDEAAALPVVPEGLVLEPEPKLDAGFEGLTLEPQGQPVPEAAETLRLEPSVELGSSSPEAAPSEPQTAPKADDPSAVRQPEPGLVLESAGSSLSAPAVSGEETLVVPPPAATSGEEEKTVIYVPGAGITSRSQAMDLPGLAAKAVPEGIPAERVRTVAFLYSLEDKALCATLLSELDSICLKSATKPMFIKRAFVRECAPDMNANYIMQTVTDAAGQGLVCVGSIPQEKIYEMENVFSSSGGFFRHYDSSSFSHTAALDLVADLILR